MAIVIDDLLLACASAAAKGAAEEFVKEIMSFLATKDDLANAIKEIETYVGQQFDDFRNDNLTVNTFSAFDFLVNYTNNPSNRTYLNDALAPLKAAQGWLDNEIAHSGEDVLRLRFAEVVKYVTTDTGIWYKRASLDRGDERNFKDSVARLNNYLTRAINQIKTMMHVDVSGITDTVDPPSDPEELHGITWYHSSFHVTCPALPGGGYNYDAGPARAPVHDQAVQKSNAIIADYNQAEQQRQTLIYNPALKLIAALQKL